MLAFKITLFGLLYFFTLASGSKCPQDVISKLVVCYYKGEISLTNFNVCNCTHVVFMHGVRRTDNNSIIATEDAKKYLEIIKEKKENLSAVFTFETKQDETSKILKSENRSEQLINGIVEFLQESLFDGVELNFNFDSNDGVSKESYATFVKTLSKTLSSHHRRVKRDGYDVIEKLQDDVTTVAYTTQTPKNSTSKTQSIKRKSRKPKENSRKIREKKENEKNDAGYLTLEEAINAEFSEEKSDRRNTLKDVEGELSKEKKFLIFVTLSIKPEIIAKKFDLKILSRYADILTVPTHHIVNGNEEHLTYHPSRLMGLSDILNTDSILDFLTGMGAQKSKMVITLPATVLKFQLMDENKNTPRSPSTSKPHVIDQSQLCVLFSKNNWTVERDEDLTAPYAFSKKTWLAFEDKISVNIKGKYILLRNLAGGAIYPIDSDLNDDHCSNHTGSGGYLTGILHKNFESLERKPRALVLESLQEEVHDTAFTSVEAGVKLSEYRIVRVVDHSGAVHVIRKNTKTQFECSRQGYFSHPLGCNKFYRCVKFDQYSDDFTVFEYECPAGLAFDERWEVCVWPGSLPHGAPCTGSSEIAPVPRSHYECPAQEGYYADPENCRWFFACLDHARDGITPLTAYEFRCPFGLVFSQQKLACDWPWLVGSCGNRGAAGYFNTHSVGQSQVIHSATFINGGNLEASFGQYGNTDQEASFIGFGKKFGSILKETNTQGSYQGAQSAGFGYIANRFDDHNNRASFATFPDYEISGGRIFNTGGVVLDQNIAGISNAASDGVVESLGEVNIRGSTAGASRSLGKNAAYFHQETVQSVGGAQSTNFQKLEPGLETSKTNTLLVSGGQISLKNSIPTPRPFSVSIPSVQINSEKISEYSKHSTVGSTVPQTLIFEEIPSTENVNIQLKEGKLNEKQHSSSYGFSSSQPTVSVGIPAVTPTTETLIHGGAISEGYDSSHLKADVSLNIPSIPISSTPRIKTYRVDQSSLKKNVFPSRFSVNEAPVTVGVPATGKQSFEYNVGSSEGKIINEAISTFVPLVTPKPVVHTFEYTARGQSPGSSSPFGSRENSFVSISQQNQKITDQNIALLDSSRQNVIGQSGISYGVPLVTAAPSISISGGKTESKSEGHLTVVSSGPTPAGFVPSTVDEKVSSELRLNTPLNYYSVPTVTPKSEFFTFSNVASNEYSGHLNADSYVISNKIPTVTPKSDFKILSQTRLNLKDVTDKNEVIPAVTPQPNGDLFKYYESHADVASVTPIVPFHSPEVTSEVKSSFGQSEVGEISKIPYNVPVAIPQSNVKNFEQISSFLKKGISQEEKASYSIPGIPLGVRTDAIVQTDGVSHSLVQPTSDIKFPQVVTTIRPVFGQRYSYSSSFTQSRNQFGSKQPFETVSSTAKPKSEIFVTKIEQPNTLTAVTIEQQPIVSVGTISSNGIERTLSTPKPLSVSQDVFPQSPAVEIFNSKSGYVQPSLGAITTPAPAISATLSTPINFENQQSSHFLGINIKPKYPQSTVSKNQEKINLENFTPAFQQTVVNVPGNIITGQKSLDFKQEIKPFAPNTHVTASAPGTITSGIDANSLFYSKSNAYLSPVISKSEVYGLVQEKSQLPVVQFETTEKNQVLIQEQPVSISDQQFLKTKPLIEERRTEYIQQAPVVSGYHNQVKVSTSKPFTPSEEFLGLEISKSVEINPSQSYQSADYHLRQNLPVKELEIQQQPLQLISQKTFPAKQIIQPFYTQKEKETVHSIINNIPENFYEKQFVLQKKINVETPKTEILKQKQYLPPAVISNPQLPLVSYSVAKTVNVEQPVVNSEVRVGVVPALPVFEASKIPLTGPKETVVTKTKTSGYLPPSGFVKSSDKAVLSEQFVSPQQPQEVVSSNVNLLLPTSTAVPQYTLSNTEELSVQTHRNFDSQKISAFNTPLGQNVLIQSEIHSTSKPVDKVFETSGGLFQYEREHDFTERGQSAFSPGTKYAINPNIAIPEPPKEYILAQNEYTTTAPVLATTLGMLSSKPIESVGSRFKGSTYLPPQISSRKNPTKTTIISVSDLNEKEFPDGNVQQFFDKFSERFGELVNKENENIVTKVIKGDGEGEIPISKEGSSTVRYEVNTATPRQNIRGRQYHGGITSGISQATSKYEEYEIDGGKSGQRSFEIGKDGQDNTDKATIDLKNVKLDKNKKTVIVVSQVSDANPVLIGKLAGQCSCQSNMLQLRSKGKKSKNSLRRKNPQNQQLQTTISNEYLPPYENNQASLVLETQTAAPDTIVIGGSKALKQDISFTTEQSLVSSSTTAHSDLVSSTILSSLGPDGVLSITPKAVYAKEKTRNKSKQFRGRVRYLQPSSAVDPVLLDGGSSAPLLSPVPASEIASTFDYTALKEDESRNQNEIDKGRGDGISEVAAGAAFDRYGPGGWRGFDETLQGSIDCKRPGLFRHPKYCNKFYACNYDPWKERYTLHVFNCPIHLTYDSSISACNWPVRGPACADDNLLV